MPVEEGGFDIAARVKKTTVVAFRLVWAGLGWFGAGLGLVSAGFGLVWAGLGWLGLVWLDLGWFELILASWGSFLGWFVLVGAGLA